MIAPRVVLDTNVALSALLFRAGSLSWLRHAWQSEAIRPLASGASICSREKTGCSARRVRYRFFRSSNSSLNMVEPAVRLP